MAKEKSNPKEQKLTIKGLNRFLLNNHAAYIKAGQAVQQALKKAGIQHLHVVIPGVKNPTGPAPRFNKRTPSKGKRSPE